MKKDEYVNETDFIILKSKQNGQEISINLTKILWDQVILFRWGS